MTWLVNGELVDIHTAHLERKHIHVENGSITQISSQLPVKHSDDLIDLDGAYVLPGFFDCHVHIAIDSGNPDVAAGWGNALPGTIALYGAQAARRMLMAGVTTARDVGGWDYHEIAVREAIRRGWIEGCRLYCAGRILSITSSSTAYYRGMYEEADGPDAVRRAARKQLAQGAQFIKVLATGAILSTEYESPHAVQLAADEIAAAVQVARDSLTYVAAHAHAPDGIRNAVEAGCRSIEHTVYGNEEVYRLMAERGAYLVPTLCTTPAMLADATFATRVTAHMRERLSDVHGTHVENIKLARRLGVKIAMGSDAGTPGNHCGENLQELEVMVKEAGFSNLEAIQSATINAATLMQVESQLGSIEAGKTADVVAVSQNPLDDICVLRSIPFVMKEGRVVRHEPQKDS